MPPFEILDADTRSVIQDALDSFLAPQADGGLGQACLVVYPPKLVKCDNCVYDPVNNRSANRPLSGGPVPFPPGAACPVCGGTGFRQSAATEELTLKTEWEFRKFLSPPPDLNLRVPHSVVMVKGFMTDLPKLLKADWIVLNLPVAPFLKQRYVLLGEPADSSSMVPGRYFVSYWERKP